MVATKKKTPLRSTPKTRKGRGLEKFAAGAGRKHTTENEVYPWEEPHVREDVKKTLPLRIDEPLYLKLKFIAQRTPYSMNSFILDRVIDEIEEEIARLTE